MKCYRNEKDPKSKKKKQVQVGIRPVKEGDIKKIFEWRNEPQVRKGMFISKRISWKTHRKFWDNLLKNKNRFAFVIRAGDQDVGVVRLDKVGDIAEVDIFISSKYQGRGLGTNAMNEIKKRAKGLNISRLTARVKPDNERSMKMFENCGFRKKYLYYEAKI
jgi:RimJ/RimL family protein N-acetyltransferase